MDAGTPKVSIGLPVYNGGEFLADALDSILAQTFRDYELIVADNASTDGTARICRDYAARDARIHYVRNATNVGASKNHGIVFALSKGRYFKWWAADDVCAPTFLEDCVRALDNDPTAVLACPRPTFIDASGRPAEGVERAFHHAAWSPRATVRFRQLIEEYMYSGGITAGLYMYGLMRSEALRQTRPLPGYAGADWITIAELILRGMFIEVPGQLLFVRAHPGSAYGGAFAGQATKAQEYLDPSINGALTVRLAGARRYAEHFGAVLRAPLDVAAKAELLAYVARSLLRRARRRLGKKPVPWLAAGLDKQRPCG